MLFAVVTVMGFMAARWRRPANLESLHEWGLGGKSFGTITTWFLLGGDLYTAYTFIAVPAAMWATWIVHVPVLREFASWNLVLVLEKH